MPGRFEPSEREALAGLSSCFNCQFKDRLQHIMFVTAPADPVYHIAKSEQLTLCNSPIFNAPDNRRRFEDRRLVADRPRDRVCFLCLECAALVGDTPSFSERVTYPTQ